METKHPAFWMGHTFSVVTGVAFIVSATLNALTFWLTWRMNSFLIASPADVVMSGFILVAAVAVVAGLIALLWWAGAAIKRSYEQEAAKKAQEQAEADAVLDDYIRVMGDRLRGFGLPADEVETILESQRMNRGQEAKRLKSEGAVKTLISMASVALAVVASLAQVVSLFDHVDGSAISGLARPWWYDTGLKAAPDYSAFGGKCADAPVAWLGSSAAILECRDGVRVIHNLDDLVTVRRY